MVSIMKIMLYVCILLDPFYPCLYSSYTVLFQTCDTFDHELKINTTKRPCPITALHINHVMDSQAPVKSALSGPPEWASCLPLPRSSPASMSPQETANLIKNKTSGK